jgi:hypothetical protein
MRPELSKEERDRRAAERHRLTEPARQRAAQRAGQQAVTPELGDRIEALETELSDVKATLAAAYTELGAGEEARPVLRVIQGGAG